MVRIRFMFAGAIVAVALAAAPAASAHKIWLSPAIGDPGSVFVVRGTAWQPSQTVTWEYFRSGPATGSPTRRGTFRGRRDGRFTFRWTDGLASDVHTLCFSQTDTRFRAPGRGFRFFRECAALWVNAPVAWFRPVTGDAGEPFTLVVQGFFPGRRVTLRLTRPDAVVETYTETTRTSGRVVRPSNGSSNVFVRRGGALFDFIGDPNVRLGLYTAEIAGDGLVARAAVLVR